MSRIHVSGLMLIMLFVSGAVFSQDKMPKKISFEKEDLDTIPFYSSLESALKSPESVIRLKLNRKKLKEFPKEILSLTNLKELDLSDNKIKRIPSEIGSLRSLERVDFSGNKIKDIPKGFGKLINLKRLRIGENDIDTLTAELSSLKKLELLDVWANPIMHFDPKLNQLKSLKFIDLRAIMFNNDEQRYIFEELWPNLYIFIDRPCDC